MNNKSQFILQLFLIVSFGYQTIAQDLNSDSKTQNSNTISCSERINLHIDRDLYIAGDNLFFKLYLTNSDLAKPNQISNYAYLILRNNNGNIVKSMLRVEKGIAFSSFYIPDTLKSGVYQLVAFTNYQRNFGEKSFYYQNILIINRFDRLLTDFYLSDSTKTDNDKSKQSSDYEQAYLSSLKIILEKDSFKTREKVKVLIKNENPNNSFEKAKLSISVKEINPLFDLKTFSSALLSQSRSEWKSEIIDSNLRTQFLPETRGVFLNGKIQNNNKEIKDECLYISTPDTAANLQYAFPNKQGYFQFLLADYYHGKNLVLKLKNNEESNDNIIIVVDDKFGLKSKFIQVLPKMSVDLKKYIFNCQDIVQIQKSYNLNKVKFEPLNQSKMASFPFVYRYPTSVVYPAKFVPLDNFDEIVSNLLMGVKVTKEKKKYEIYVANFITKTYFNYQPAIFLDGVPIDNVNQIMSLNSNDINKVEINNILKIKGVLNFPGVLSIFTNKNLINSFAFNKPFIKLKIDPASKKSYFDTPVYNNSINQSIKPDFRQVLYWNPDIELKQNISTEIEFYTSDYISDYLIEVKGFSELGTPLVSYALIKVCR